MFWIVHIMKGKNELKERCSFVQTWDKRGWCCVFGGHYFCFFSIFRYLFQSHNPKFLSYNANLNILLLLFQISHIKSHSTSPLHSHSLLSPLHWLLFLPTATTFSDRADSQNLPQAAAAIHLSLFQKRGLRTTDDRRRLPDTIAFTLSRE